MKKFFIALLIISLPVYIYSESSHTAYFCVEAYGANVPYQANDSEVYQTLAQCAEACGTETDSTYKCEAKKITFTAPQSPKK